MTEITTYQSFTEEQHAARSNLIKLIEAERRAFQERIQPYIDALSNIHGTITYVVNKE